MYDVLVKSSLFGLRNADKVLNTNDKGRIFADIGQFANAAKAAAELDNAVGKGAQTSIKAMHTLAQSHKVLRTAEKAVKWSSKHVNPLLVGAAGYRVLIADDKESALKREIFGMSAMFATEKAIKVLYRDRIDQMIKTIPNKKLQILANIAKGVFFVMGSIAGSTVGYAIGKHFFPDKKAKENDLSINLEMLKYPKAANNAATSIETPKVKVDDIDDSEYFAITKKEKALA